MINILDSEQSSIKEKNNAVYVLGQLADKKALPKLQSLYSGVPQNKEPLDTVLSQYEIEKAIKWCENGNATSWMYKNLR
jgi:hypothetical protein